LNSRTDDQGDMEGFPNSILEAMSMGKAVISTYHAGIPAIIDNGQNGVLVHEKDNTELLQAMEMLTANTFLRKQIGANARLKVQNNFELSGMKLELQKLVQNS
jgi:glycosyltransferase involved in cell wall biosynthesis